MKRFDLYLNVAEINYRDRKNIKPFCTIDNDEDPTLINSYDTEEEALEALRKYKSSVEYRSAAVSYYLVKEYHVEENEYDEDGEFVCGSDIIDVSEMDFEEE